MNFYDEGRGRRQLSEGYALVTKQGIKTWFILLVKHWQHFSQPCPCKCAFVIKEFGVVEHGYCNNKQKKNSKKDWMSQMNQSVTF